MCVVKTPKVSAAASAEKPVQVFTNRYFVDRGEDAVAARLGRNSLRINRGGSSPTAPPAGIAPSPTAPVTVGIQSPMLSGAQAPTIRAGGYGYDMMRIAR